MDITNHFLKGVTGRLNSPSSKIKLWTIKAVFCWSFYWEWLPLFGMNSLHLNFSGATGEPTVKLYFEKEITEKEIVCSHWKIVEEQSAIYRDVFKPLSPSPYSSLKCQSQIKKFECLVKNWVKSKSLKLQVSEPNFTGKRELVVLGEEQLSCTPPMLPIYLHSSQLVTVSKSLTSTT